MYLDIIRFVFVKDKKKAGEDVQRPVYRQWRWKKMVDQRSRTGLEL